MATNKANTQKANPEATKAAETDSAARAGMSESGSVGTYGAEAETKKENKDSNVYVVKDGDSLDSIAEENGVDKTELMSLNPEIEPFTNHVYTGQEIKLK